MGLEDKVGHWVLTSLREDFPRFSESFKAFCQANGVGENKLFDLEISLEELIVNSFSHGYKSGGVVTVSAQIVDGELKVTLEDKAPPFDLLREAPDVPEGDLADREPGGLGIHLVKSLSDRVEYHGSRGGNQITIFKSIAE